jgi:DNA-binding transcriptional LysR family regulator
MFQQRLQRDGLDPAQLEVALELPSNEAVRSAVEAGAGAAVMSLLVAESSLRAGTLVQIEFDLPSRPFVALCRRDRQRTRAEEEFLRMLRATTHDEVSFSHPHSGGPSRDNPRMRVRP